MSLSSKYHQEFDSCLKRIEELDFESIYNSETSYSFKKKVGACPFCGSGSRGTKDSTGAFYFYASLNIAKCHSCGTSSGITKLVMHQHGFEYKQAIHYIAKHYLHVHLEDPNDKFEVKAQPKVKIEVADRKRIGNEEAQAEEQKRKETFEYIKGLILPNVAGVDSKMYLQSRGIDTANLPTDSFYQAQAYKNLPIGVVFFDTEYRCLNKRYIGTLPEGVAKTFTFGQMHNSVYACTYRPELDDVFIFEGVINSQSLYQVGKSCIALFATSNYIDDIEKFAKYFEGKNVIIAFDGDKAGLQAAIKQAHFIINSFNIKSISILLFPEKQDANDLLQKGELASFIDNTFNYAILDKQLIESELQKIEADRKNYIPNLKSNNYYSRPAANEETDGTLKPIKAEKLPEEILEKIRSTKSLTPHVFKNFEISYLDEYTVIDKRVAHTHKSTTENPIFSIQQNKECTIIWRPFAQKPYHNFETYGNTNDFNLIGLKQLKVTYENINRVPVSEDESKKAPKEQKLERISICYNLVDFLNLAAIGENVVFNLNDEFDFTDFEALEELTDEIYQIPTNDKKDIYKSRKIGLKHIDIRTFYVPQLNGTRVNTISCFIKEHPDIRVFKKRLNTALPFKFWEFEKGDYDVNIIKLRNFLSANGYYTYKNLQDRQGYMYIKITGRIVSKMDKDTFNRHIETFVDNYLEKRGENVKLRNKISISSRLSEGNLSGIKEISLDFENSGKNFQNWFFKDGSMWIVTEKSIKHVSQNTLQKYVWDNELLDYPSKPSGPAFRIFYQQSYLDLKLQLDTLDAKSKEYAQLKMKIAGMKPTEIFDIEILDRENYFLQFLFLTSFAYFEDVERTGIEIKAHDFWYNLTDILTDAQLMEIKIHLINKLTWLGYMMKDYKSMADDYGLAILDAIDNEENGKRKGAAGGGKSIITKAIKQVKRTLILKAEAEDFCENKHRYENYDGERVIVADDMHLKSRIGNMLTDFSEGIEVNPKHKRPMKIPFLESPKIIITRNYIDDEGERVDRRLGRIFVFPFFHDNKGGRHKVRRRPNDYFGRMLFQDDTPEDKSKLVNLFANCYQANLQFGEINPPLFDMEKFRMINRIGEPLIEYLDIYFEGGQSFGFIERVPFYNKFIDEFSRRMNPYQKSTLYSTSQKFKALVEVYCELRGYLFNPDRLLTDTNNKRIIMKSDTQMDKDGKPKNAEFFYIGLKEADIIARPLSVEDETFGEAQAEEWVNS